MKDSGVEWLGTIPEHWDIERAKNLFTKMERPVRESDEVITCFRDGTVTLRRKRRTEGFTESLKEIGYQGIRVGDLVIHAMDAFAGAVGVADSDGKGTPVYAVCKPKSKANAQYHALVIREMARNKWILALATGIRERSTDFRFSTYANQRVPLPPLPEQVAIARYLDYVDVRVRRLTEAKRKLIGLLTEYKQAIIHRAVTRGLDPNVPLKDSGSEWLGMVPQHWEVRRADHKLGVSKKLVHPNEISGQQVVHYSIPNVQQFGKGVVERGAHVDSTKIIIDKAVVLVSKLNPRKCTVVYAEPDTEFLTIASSEFVALEPRECDGHFLEYLYASEDVRLELSSRVNSATKSHQRCSPDDISKLQLALPPISEQVGIVEYLDRTTAEIDIAVARAERQIELLNEYRTRLIADVVTGKLDVRDATLVTEDPDTSTGSAHRSDLNGGA